MKNKGINIDASLFDLKFVEPRALVHTKKLKYMRLEQTVFGGLEGVHMSRRFILGEIFRWN